MLHSCKLPSSPLFPYSLCRSSSLPPLSLLSNSSFPPLSVPASLCLHQTAQCEDGAEETQWSGQHLGGPGEGKSHVYRKVAVVIFFFLFLIFNFFFLVSLNFPSDFFLLFWFQNRRHIVIISNVDQVSHSWIYVCSLTRNNNGIESTTNNQSIKSKLQSGQTESLFPLTSYSRLS